MPLSIIHYPHPTLRHESKPLRRVDAGLVKMVQEMLDLMYEHEGIGLAANQVDLPYRLFVINPTGDPDQREAEQVFVNPVLSGGKGQEAGREGCLSLPGVHAPVVRSAKVKVEAFDLRGNQISGEVSGLHARVLQHERDHLDGVMFIDRLPPAVRADVEEHIQEFEVAFASRQESGEAPTEGDVAKWLAELEALRT